MVEIVGHDSIDRFIQSTRLSLLLVVNNDDVSRTIQDRKGEPNMASNTFGLDSVYLALWRRDGSPQIHQHSVEYTIDVHHAYVVALRLVGTK